jgi:hypothetical protein
MATFTDIVFDVTSQYPQLDIYGLSATDKSFVLDTTTGNFGGLDVNGILYNGITGVGAATVTLSAGGVQFRVATAYNNTQAALYLADRTSVLFTVLTAATAALAIASTATYNQGPNERRLLAIEAI